MRPKLHRYCARMTGRLDVNSGKIARIRHYTRCPWLLQAADRIFVDGHHRTLNQQALDEGMLA